MAEQVNKSPRFSPLVQFEKHGKLSVAGRDHDIRAAIDRDEGLMIQRTIETLKPRIYLEVGLAFGISALYAQEALQQIGQDFTHIVIDPYQGEDWQNIGIKMLDEFAAKGSVRLIEQFSELALADLLRENIVIDVAFIDGMHTFDHALVDFFFINKMLRVGGVVIFDDAHWPSVGKLVRHVTTYPCYKQIDSSGEKSLARKIASTIKRMSLTGVIPRAVAFQKVAEDQRDYMWHSWF